MVTLSDIQASNAKLATALPEGLVAVFVGGTRGIGETSLKQFAKNTRKPRIYLIGRSEANAKRVIDECKTLNSEGQYNFIGADISLIRSVDEVCKEIASREKAINLLFLTPGTFTVHTETPEKLHFFMSLNYYARTRFILNLLPLLRVAPDLRRVVTVFAGTKEGQIDTSDFQARKLSLMASRGHVSSMITLSLEALEKKAPEVSFVHVFPGAVTTDLGQDLSSLPLKLAARVYKFVVPLFAIPNDEAGERHLFFSTSGRYPPREGGAAGLPRGKGVEPARGTDGSEGSGVYSISWDGTAQGEKAEKLLKKLRQDGVYDKLWEHTEDEFRRIVEG